MNIAWTTNTDDNWINMGEHGLEDKKKSHEYGSKIRIYRWCTNQPTNGLVVSALNFPCRPGTARCGVPPPPWDAVDHRGGPWHCKPKAIGPKSLESELKSVPKCPQKWSHWFHLISRYIKYSQSALVSSISIAKQTANIAKGHEKKSRQFLISH